MYEIKSVSSTLCIKDIDPGQGMIKGYASIFDNKDSDGDIIKKGAFKRSLINNGDRIKHLYQHDPMRPVSSTRGGTLKLNEDGKGLYFESKVSQTSWGTDLVKLHQDGVVDEMSIGFQTIEEKDNKDGRYLLELKLWEISSVTWGANELAKVQKSLFDNPEALTEKMDTVMKALRSGKYENEEIFDQLEIYLKQLQNLFTKATSPISQEIPDSVNNKQFAEKLYLLTI